MKQMLAEIFGTQLRAYQEKQVKLPLYLKDNRSFFDVEIYGQQFVLVVLPANIRFNAAALKKQYMIYISKFHTMVAYGFERITTFQRKSMIENQLPFVAGNNQIFLPFIGTCFSKCESAQLSAAENHFTPASQMLFLLLLYSDDNLWINKGQAAKMLGIAPMSVSRAALQLKQLGITEEENMGTETRIHRKLSRTAACDAAADFLLNPIQKTMFVHDEFSPALRISAGEYALSLRSDLSYPGCKEFAINKKTAEAGQWTICDPNLVINADSVRVQVWRYPPELFAQGDTVDPVSLLCSFRENQDERIHKCLQSIREEIEAWPIGI